MRPGEIVHVHAQMNISVKSERPSRRRKVWTAQDDEDLRYWHACRYTDGRIAKKLGCCRRTVLRQREAIGLRAVDHPRSCRIMKNADACKSAKILN